MCEICKSRFSFLTDFVSFLWYVEDENGTRLDITHKGAEGRDGAIKTPISLYSSTEKKFENGSK